MTASSTFDSSAPTRGIHCQGCDQHLPLRMSGPAEIAALWECAACGTAFAGILVAELAPLLAKFVRLSQIHFGKDHVEPLPANFAQDVALLLSKQTGPQDPEKRRSPREFPHLDATAVGLDAKYMLTGPACRGYVANLSAHGMLLATALPLQTANVCVQMHTDSEKVQLLGKIVWSRELGPDCYGAGVDFVARFGKVVCSQKALSPSSAGPA